MAGASHDHNPRRMRRDWRLILASAAALLPMACAYIVLPPEEENPSRAVSRGWAAIVTDVGKSDTGDLRIALTLRNDTGDWSAMKATTAKPAVLSGGGNTVNCDASLVGSGGHRLAPGFQMRGYTAGTRFEPRLQQISVDCDTAEAPAGSTLAFDYSYFTGEYNYYEQEANKVNAHMEISLDEVDPDLSYPVAEPLDGLIVPATTEIVAINKVTLRLTAVERNADGLHFDWLTDNPGEYPSYVHIGIPPVIGSDGIIYGVYETPDLAAVPVTGAGKTAEWQTDVAVPTDVDGLYILLSVESKKQRLFVDYAVDVSDV